MASWQPFSFLLCHIVCFPLCVILHVCLLLCVCLSELVGVATSVQVAVRWESSAPITSPSPPKYKKTSLRFTRRQIASVS